MHQKVSLLYRFNTGLFFLCVVVLKIGLGLWPPFESHVVESTTFLLSLVLISHKEHSGIYFKITIAAISLRCLIHTVNNDGFYGKTRVTLKTLSFLCFHHVDGDLSVPMVCMFHFLL